MNIEIALRDALREARAPDGFAERVVARLAEQKANDANGSPRWKQIAAAAAIVAATGLFSVSSLQRMSEAAAGERASRELMVAMKIASEKTNLAAEEILSPLGERKRNGG